CISSSVSSPWSRRTLMTTLSGTLDGGQWRRPPRGRSRHDGALEIAADEPQDLRRGIAEPGAVARDRTDDAEIWSHWSLAIELLCPDCIPQKGACLSAGLSPVVRCPGARGRVSRHMLPAPSLLMQHRSRRPSGSRVGFKEKPRSARGPCHTLTSCTAL